MYGVHTDVSAAGVLGPASSLTRDNLFLSLRGEEGVRHRVEQRAGLPVGHLCGEEDGESQGECCLWRRVERYGAPCRSGLAVCCSEEAAPYALSAL